MSIRQLAARRFVRGEGPRPKRSGLFTGLTLGAGALAGIAALLGIPPFGNLQAIATHVLQGTNPVIEARALFPPVPPTHKVVDVYDPALPGQVAAPPRANPPGANPPGASPPNPAPRPVETFPVINFPPGPLSAIEATCEAAKQAAQNKSAAYQANVERQCEAAKQAYERAHP